MQNCKMESCDAMHFCMISHNPTPIPPSSLFYTHVFSLGTVFGYSQTNDCKDS